MQILKTSSDQDSRQGPEMYHLQKTQNWNRFSSESLFNHQLCEDTMSTERIKLLVDGNTSNSGSDCRFKTTCSESDENPSENV